MTWQWIEAGFTRLAEKYGPLHRHLIVDRRLRLAFSDAQLDCVDLYSASLVAAAVANRKSLCIILPDSNPRRPAFLFGYALLNQWWKTRDVLAHQRRCILYCGSHTGIRDQLAKVAVAGLGESLAEVFSQVDLARSERRPSSDPASTLPPVVTAYSPADPSALLSDLNPVWVAVDLGDATSLRWLLPLLAHAKEKNIPVLAWGTNPMSPAIAEIATCAHIVQWPFGRTFQEDSKFEREEYVERIFQPYIVTALRPILIETRKLTNFSGPLTQATTTLLRLSDQKLSQFARNALHHHWRLLRTLESLHVPLPLYEAEVHNHWGQESIWKQMATCERFRSALAGNDARTVSYLEEASNALTDVANYLSRNDPPLWGALVSLVREEANEDQARLITLTSRAKKSLFTLSLLAKEGITIDDLGNRRNWIVTLDELRDMQGYSSGRSCDSDRIPRNLSLVPIVVALPNLALYGKLWPAFLGEDASIILYDFQLNLLKSRARAWNTSLTADPTPLARALSDLIPFPYAGVEVPPAARLSLMDSVIVQVKGIAALKEGSPQYESISSSYSLEGELSSLFEEDDDDSLVDLDESDGFDPVDRSNEWVEESLVVRFSDGWFGRFELGHRLNYINQRTRDVDERLIQSLRIGDTVLIIPFQRRQSLYGLILSRIHKHPAIGLHLALLRRWREDLLVGYERWARLRYGNAYRTMASKNIVEGFLKELQQAGCSLTSTLTVQFWMSGMTLCPSDPEDVLRVGQILQVRFIEDQHRKISAAATRIRGLHRGLSMRLNHWLADRARGMAKSHDREVIDQETGLTFGEVRDSFVIANVESVRTVRGSVLRNSLGIITKGSGDVEPG